MPVGVNVHIDGPTAEVEVLDPQLRREIGRQLVDAARPDSWRVDVVTVGRPCPTFRAPLDIVDRAGLLDHPEPDRHEHLHWAPPGTYSVVVSEPAPPPRTGKGSGTTEWQTFLTTLGIPWDPDDSRADLIARWDDHHDGRT